MSQNILYKGHAILQRGGLWIYHQGAVGTPHEWYAYADSLEEAIREIDKLVERG
jgi:hypothetical protein